jgi:catechol 2,3-dioxygenase-like lactoylglutathione lyase family enzyme
MQHTLTKLSTSVVYTTVASINLDSAERFYRDTLGFDVERMGTTPDNLMVHCGQGTGLNVYERPTVPNCDTTAAAFIVEDIEATVADLRTHGVVFEEYDLPYLKTTNGIGLQGTVKGAWFKDPDGNTLSIIQM